MHDIYLGALEYAKEFAGPLLLSIELLVISIVFGFMLAIPLAVCRTAKNPLVFALATAYSAIFRGTPLLVQLFIIYYGLGQFEAIRSSFAWYFLSSSLFCAALALVLNLAAYMCEHIRAGMLSVPQGEREAAVSLGVSHSTVLFGIVIPRALKVATPALTNEVIAQLKGTALASTITVIELTGEARRLSAQTYTLDPLIIAGVIYAFLTFVIGTVARLIERRGNRYLSRTVEPVSMLPAPH